MPSRKVVKKLPRSTQAPLCFTKLIRVSDLLTPMPIGSFTWTHRWPASTQNELVHSHQRFRSSMSVLG